MDSTLTADALASLHNTLILLGGRRDIAAMLLRPELIDESDVNAIRHYNIDLQESLKGRLVSITTVEVQAANDDVGEEATTSACMSLPR